MRTFEKKALRIGGVTPRSGGYPPYAGHRGGSGSGFLGWGAGFFWGVPRFFIDALDR